MLPDRGWPQITRRGLFTGGQECRSPRVTVDAAQGDKGLLPRPRAAVASAIGIKVPKLAEAKRVKCRREITLDSLIAADSSSFSVRCFSRVRSSVRSRRYRACSRITRNPRARSSNEQPPRKPAPPARLIRGLNRTKKVMTSRALPQPFFTPVRRRAGGTKG